MGGKDREGFGDFHHVVRGPKSSLKLYTEFICTGSCKVTLWPMNSLLYTVHGLKVTKSVHGLKVTKSVHVQYYSKEGEGLG